MPFALCRATTGNVRAAAEVVENGRLQWLRFGSEYFCYGPDITNVQAAGRIDAAGLALHRLPAPTGQIAEEHLHLVVQEGSLFRRAHPDVPVLLDRGRHMLVAVEPVQASRLSRHQAQFSLRPVAWNQAVFDVATSPDVRPLADPETRQVVDALSRSRYADTLAELASYPARHSLSSHFHDAARRARDRLQLMGYQARLEEVELASGKTLNVVAEMPGAYSDAGKVTVVAAHLDTAHHGAGPSRLEDVTAPAPGVDDNGSGSAGVLEIARAFKGRKTRHDLRFILFGGQEQGLCGSKRYVERLAAAERSRIGAVVNMDMIGVVRTDTPTVLLEGAAVSKEIIDALASAAHTYTGLKVHTSYHYDSSDHAPFLDAGVPAVLTVEGDDTAGGGSHAVSDTLNNINHDYAMDILRMNTAFIAREVAG